jgi:type II secretory pathway component HofQ
MLRSALLAVALSISGFTYAVDTPANAPTPAATAQPCSDYVKHFPPCDIPKTAKNKAKKLYAQGIKLAREKKLNEALEKLKEVRAISPLDIVYQSAEAAIRGRVVSEELRIGNKAMLSGDAAAALGSFRRAAEIDPTNEYAQQRLRDALPIPEELAKVRLRADLGEVRLRPSAGVHSFEFKGSSTQLLGDFARAFGIAVVEDQGLMSRPVRIKLDDVDWETGSQILARIAKVLIIPMSDRQVLLLNDTDENRRDMTRMTLRTFYALGGTSPQELTELTTALRVLFDLRYITSNASAGSIVISAPQATMDAIASFLEYLQDDRPTVMLEIKIYEVSSTLTRDLGTSMPNQFTVFNVNTELQNLVSSSTYQQIVAALNASGQPVNATTILAALLASSSSTSTVLTQPFATVGGGLTLTGVTIPSTSAHLSVNNSLARTVDDVLLRAGHGKAATLKVGERYPIVNSQFSATSATSSLLSSLGLSSSTAAAIPSPQFSYEDLGLTLKATPQVHGTLVSLDYELTLRALGTTQVNGLPLIDSRELKGTISTEDGKAVVIAGMIDKSEVASINGIPGISSIPGLGNALSDQTREYSADELLVVLTPHISSGWNQTGSYIRMPMNSPKK